MANSYKNIVITPNTGSTTGDPTIVFSGGDTNTNTDITLRVYPTSNGTLSFEGNAGQLFSITNDLSNTIFSVNDVSGIPLLEINVASQQITLGQFYGNVGIGTNASNVNNYKLDVIGGANISLPNLTVGGTNVSAAIAAANANAATLSANVNVLAAATVANDASQGANIATLAAAFVSNSQSLSANVNTLAANVNTLAGAAYPKTGGTISGDVTVTGSLTVSGATTYVNTQTLLIGDNLVTLNADLPGNVQPTENAGLEINRGARTSNAAFIWNENANSWQFTSNTLAGVYSIIASQTDANNVGAAANNFAAATYLTQSAFNSANANSVSQSANVNALAAAFVSNSQTLSANVNTLAATFASANANSISLSANVNVLAAAVVANDASQGANIATLAAAFVANSQTLSANVNTLAAALVLANTSSHADIDALSIVANAKVSSVTGTSGRITSSGGATPAIDLATAGAGAASYSSGISAVTVDAYGRVTSVTGSANYVVSGGALGTPSSGTLTNCTFPTLNQNTTGSAAKLASQGQYANSAPGNTRGSTGLNLYEVYNNGYPTTYGNILHTYGAGAGQLLIGWSGVDGQTTDNFIRSKRDNDTGAWSSWAKIITDQNITSYGYVTSSGVTSITAGTGLSGGTITSTGTISLPSTGPGAGSYSSGISALTIDAQGRITAITGSAGYLTSSTGLANTSGVSFNGNLFFPTGNVGIGVSSTVYKLQLQRTAGAATNGEIWSGDGTYWTQLNSRQSAGAYSPLVAAGDHALIYSDGTAETGAFVIGQWSSSAKGIRINASGDVGIGNTSPGHKLSVNGTAYFTGKITSAVADATDGLDLVSFNAIANMRIIRNNGGGTSDGMYIGYGNAGSATTKIYGGGATTGALEKFSDYTLEPGSFRSPIFYDSNNTAYYVDPAGLTNIDRMQINSANTGVVLSVGDSGLDNGSTYGMVNLTRAADTVRPHLAFIRSGSYVWQTGYLSGTNSLGFFPWNFSGSQGTPALYMTTGSIVYAPTEFRTPIIYDNNNTAYYFDGAGTSVMNRIQFDTTNVAAPTTNQAVGSRLTLYPTGGTGHYSIGIEGSHMWFNTPSGYKWYVNETNWATLNADYFQHNSDIRAPIFYDSDNTGYYVDPAGTSYCSNIQVAGSFIVGTGGTWTSGSLYSDSNWGMLQRARQASPVHAQFAWYESTGATQLLSIDTSYNLISSYSMRSPIFYDSNNTAYYVDPASTSILNKVTLSNGSSGVLNGLDDYHQIILRGYPSNATTGITATDVTSFSEYGGDFRFYRKNGSSLDLLTEINTDYLSHYSDIRTPIFYDSNNTGYYLDPAGTSALLGVSVFGALIGRTDTAANTSVANDTGSMSIRGSTTKPATVSFHRSGAYAINMGLDTDNIFRIGGWSDGVNTYRLQLQGPGGTHTFNGTVAATTFSGAGTSLTGTAASLTAGNATTAGGFTPSTVSGAASRIVVADVNGYVFNNYFNSTDDVSAGTVSYIMAKFGDNYYRSATAAKVATFLASQSFASPTFTGTITIPGFNGTNEIKAGTGDGASFTTYNVTIRSHYGIGFRDYTDSTTVKAYIDCRTGNIGSSGSIIDAYGNLRGAPVDSKSAQYTLVATDTGKTISITTGGIIVPANVMSAGDIVTIFNNSGSSQTITTTGVTAYLAGTATTGNRTLLQRGVANILCVASNVFVISGSGLT